MIFGFEITSWLMIGALIGLVHAAFGSLKRHRELIAVGASGALLGGAVGRLVFGGALEVSGYSLAALAAAAVVAELMLLVVAIAVWLTRPRAGESRRRDPRAGTA